MTGNEVINIKAIQILWDFSVVIWLIYIEDKTTEIKLWSIFESHTPIMYTADKWKSLAYDSFICEVISSVHTDGVCEDCDKRLPIGGAGILKVICDHLTYGGEYEHSCVYTPAKVKAKSQTFYCPLLWSNI